MMDCLLSHRLEGTGPPLQLGASLENSIVIAAGSSSGTLARSHVEAPHSSVGTASVNTSRRWPPFPCLCSRKIQVLA
jgi:hypothetical protein